ncbi:MAG: putative porin [Hyphomicrobium sp.]|jgi:hypothetical protein
MGLAIGGSLLGLLSPIQAMAEDAAAVAKSGEEKLPKVSKQEPPAPSTTTELINLLVQNGSLTEEQAKKLSSQAQDEDFVAREAVKEATAKAEAAEKTAAAATAALPSPGSRRVNYVPDSVKKKLREEIRREVLETAERENWASPGKYPEWASRIRFSGDIRSRYQGSFFPSGNGRGTDDQVNFNAINTGNPIDLDRVVPFGTTRFPDFNFDQDRNQFRLRARLGAQADLSEGFTAGLRIATGDSASPVSTNQSLGGSGGNFSKYQIWLDRAYISYHPTDDVTLTTGRFENPFFSPSDLVWDTDLNFDGAVLQYKDEITPGFTAFASGGAFPLFNTDFNFSTFRSEKLASHDKWLYGAQGGFGAKIGSNYSFKFGAAYYDFTNVEGELSSPCTPLVASDPCDTDLTRPSFAQRGNTYRTIRNIVQQVDTSNNLTPAFQYFGLASSFQDLTLSAQLDLAHFNPVHVVFEGEYVRNLAFDRAAIDRVARNNLAGLPAGSTNAIAPFEGGDTGWSVGVTVGYPKLTQRWDWNVFGTYKYLESDAVVDAFTDSDFGLGGTNLQGYIIGGNLALGANVSMTGRWISASNIAGAPFDVDSLFVDLNSKF